MTQGDNESAMRSFDACLELATELGDLAARASGRQFRGSAEQFEGNLADAEASLAEVVNFHRESGVVNSLTVLATSQLGFVLCLMGKPDRAIELCEECRAVSEVHGEQWALSWADWVRGLALWTVRDYRAAAVALNQSLAAKHALDDRLGMSACVELLAWVAIEEGDAPRAYRLLDAAVRLRASVGHPLSGPGELLAIPGLCVQQIQDRLGRKAFDQHHAIGEQTAADEVVAAEPDEPRLTRRERQVAELIAEGLSNKQIATRLVISRRTAEGHVEKVLSKMGFQSRTQVAAWFAARI